MANAVLLSKFSATKLLPQPNYGVGLPNVVRFTPIRRRRRLDFSAWYVKEVTALKMMKMKMKMKKPKPKPPTTTTTTTTRSIPRREEDIISWEKCASRVVVMMGALVLGLGIMSFPATAMGKPVHVAAWQGSRRRRAAAAAAAATACSCLPKPSSQEEEVPFAHPAVLVFLVLFWIMIAVVKLSEALSELISDTTVLQLQVGLLDPARSLLRELTLLSKLPPTSTLHPQDRLFAAAVRALLCHPDYCISAYSSVSLLAALAHVETNADMDQVRRRIRRLLCECNAEQAKPNPGPTHNPTSLWFRRHDNACVVMTMLVAVRGTHTIPTIKASVDLKAALEKLESIPPSQMRYLWVFWTPSHENKTLSEKELERYPLLKLKKL